MISENPRRRGRRRASWRVTVEDCAQIEATPELLLSPGSPLTGGFPEPGGESVSVPLAGSWPDGTPISFTVEIVTTRQHLGGVRYWFACPLCGGRCRFLYSPCPNRPFWCRDCWGLPYESQHRRRWAKGSSEAMLSAILRWGERQSRRRRRRRRRSPASPGEGQRGSGSTETPMQESGTTSLDHYRAAWRDFLRDLE